MKMLTFSKDRSYEDEERLDALIENYDFRIAPHVENDSRTLRLLNPDLSMEFQTASFS
jgi:hypothetical protein